MFPTVPYLILSPGNLFHTLFTTRYSKKLLPKKRCPIQASCSSGCCCCAACKMELNTCENTQAVTQMHPHTVAYDARTCTITSCSLCPFIRRHSLEHRISYTAHPSSLSLLYPSVRLSLRPSSLHILWPNWRSCASAAVVIRAGDSHVARRLSTRYSVTFVRNGKMPKWGKCARNDTHLLRDRDYLIKYLLKNKTGAKFRMRIACRIWWAMLMPTAIYLFIFIHRNSRAVLSQYAPQSCFFSLQMKILLILLRDMSHHKQPWLVSLILFSICAKKYATVCCKPSCALATVDYVCVFFVRGMCVLIS